jgi:hypothetical protein
MGARQTSLMTGFCVSKQSWKLDLKRKGTETFIDDGEERERDVWVPHIDRPDCQLIPPENCVIDPACDWTNPAQDSAYFIIKWPMRIDEIRRKQRDPAQAVEQGLGGGAEVGRRGRDVAGGCNPPRARAGHRPLRRDQCRPNFDVIWVWESYIRTAGEDWTFISIGDKHMLTDPAPVEEVYPEQGGERPLSFGYGSFEAFCIFPQAAVESWQMLQQEANDVRNLTLDAFKQNVMPVTKVVRGRQIDLDQLKRRGQGTSIMVNKPDDVTWEKPPDVPQSAATLKQQLDIEFDDLAGQQNYGTVQDNNALGKTLGGLKLAAGAANAVQEFDIAVWVETWAENALNQIVRLEQYYESDPIVLGLCGDRAQLMEKHGISEITDDLLENNVTIRVNIGFGAGDPQQRLAKFNSAVQVALPMAQLDPRFKSGEFSVDSEEVFQEVFGGAGYRDGGKRFIKKGQPQANAGADAAADKLKSEAEKNRSQAKKNILDALSNAAKVGIDVSKLELAVAQHKFDVDAGHMEQLGKAREMGHAHGMAIADRKMAAQGLNPDGTPIVPPGQEAAGADGEPAAAAPAPVPGEDPAALGGSAAPAADAGQQQMPVNQPAKPRSIKITGRGPDGRANQFEVA